MAHKGYFKPVNPQKYKGDHTQIVYRSRWECVCMSKFDTSDSVIWWQSEAKVIPYISPKDKKYHRYFVDFTVCVKNENNIPEIFLVEVKPKYQTVPPVRPKGDVNKSRKYINEVITYGINLASYLTSCGLALRRFRQ